LAEKEYMKRKADINLFILARKGNQKADKELTDRGNKLIRDILPHKDLLGNVWEILYGRSPDDVIMDIKNKGLDRVLREIAKCVANKYVRDWDNGTGAIYGRSKNSRISSLRQNGLHQLYDYLINR